MKESDRFPFHLFAMLVLGVVLFCCLGDGGTDVGGAGEEETRTRERRTQKKGHKLLCYFILHGVFTATLGKENAQCTQIVGVSDHK